MIYIVAGLFAILIYWLVFEAKKDSNRIEALKTGKYGAFELTNMYNCGLAIDRKNKRLAFCPAQVTHENSYGALVVLDRTFVCNLADLTEILVKLPQAGNLATVQFHLNDKIPELNIQNYVWLVVDLKEVRQIIAAEFTEVKITEIKDAI